jgi:phosphotransferase system enzyme I (PtsI)
VSESDLEADPAAEGPLVLRGVAASPGVAVGRAWVIDRRRIKTPKRHVADAEIDLEVTRFETALQLSEEQLDRVKKKLAERDGDDHFLIIEAHQLILHDEHLVEPTKRRIRDEKINAEWALRKTVEEIKSVFDAIGEDYFRERRSDVDFVGDRILRNLIGEETALKVPPAGAVIVAHDLSPADTASLHRTACAAFVTDVGGKTSHSAILARAFEIPSVVGLERVSDLVGTGDLVIVDGLNGQVIIRPSEEQCADYRRRAQVHLAFIRELRQNRDLPAETADGARVRLYANVEIVEEVPAALEHGAEGIGLYRTEFLYLDRPDLPREEEHFMHARGVLRRLYPYPTTFRTFDLGGDKQAPFRLAGLEENPALGLRSIRLCLKERPLFKSQLRGLLRASVHGRMRLMFPMISGVDELREAKAVLEEAKVELIAEGHPFDAELPVGIMVEMPSAVVIADMLAKECDFISIGTNDLIQYTLAIDRVNEHVGYLYHPLHPAILRMIRTVVEAAHAAGVRVGICGEMAGEPYHAVILLGLGVDEMSMNSTSIPVVKSVVRGAKLDEARALAQKAIDLPRARDIEGLVREFMRGHYAAELLDAAGRILD